MATKRSTGKAFTGFSSDVRSAEEFQRQFIDAPMNAARLPAMGTILEVASLLEMLPDAFAASRQRELARITAVSGEQDPRAERLRNSLEQVDQVKVVAQRGRTRLERMIAVPEDDEVFHGFVAGPELTPVEGATVRVTGAAKAHLSAVTDADGYFRIVYGKSGKRSSKGYAAGQSSGHRLPDSISGMFARMRARVDASRAAATGDAAGAASQPAGAMVEIVRGGAVLHRDPVPVVFGEGRIYREYVITGKAETPAKNESTPAGTAFRKRVMKVKPKGKAKK